MDFTKPKAYPPLSTMTEADERILQISNKYGKCISVSCYVCGNGHLIPDAFEPVLFWLSHASIDGPMFDDCYICGGRLKHKEIVEVNLREFFCHLANFYRKTRFRDICVNYVKIRRNGKPFSYNQTRCDSGELANPLNYIAYYYERIKQYDYRCGISVDPFDFRRYTYLSALKIIIKDMIDDGVLESSTDTSWINADLQEIIKNSH